MMSAAQATVVVCVLVLCAGMLFGFAYGTTHPAPRTVTEIKSRDRCEHGKGGEYRGGICYEKAKEVKE